MSDLARAPESPDGNLASDGIRHLFQTAFRQAELVIKGCRDRSGANGIHPDTTGNRLTGERTDLKSTEVLPDHRVVFRIYAPKAGAVTLSGDFVTQGRGTAGPMQKDDDGVWSLTVGPLIPDFYSYSFNVDGVRTIDPRNPMVKQG